MGHPAGKERKGVLKSQELGEFELRPGLSLRLGRHRDNDVVLDDVSVSRFHARVTWDAELELPVVFDNGSQNGTFVDEVKVRSAEQLRDGAKLAIGPFVLRVALQGVGEMPAILKDTGDMVALFSESGDELGGVIGPGPHGVRELMERLESERRTGTLQLRAEVQATVVYCLGRIMTADVPGHGQGLRALERILQLRRGEFSFTRELEPQEEALNLWVSDFIRSRERRDDETTKRFGPTQRSKRPPLT
ncbi:MAG: FHA domain-containing protein [Planctomycetota bacterium]